jgi:hypothetical protein
MASIQDADGYPREITTHHAMQLNKIQPNKFESAINNRLIKHSNWLKFQKGFSTGSMTKEN